MLDLFDSLYRGFPVGSLLLWKRPAEADRLRLGPLTIEANESPEAWWVVDGQQRLTALTVGLTRSEPIPKTPEDHYVVYFDAGDTHFKSPPRTGVIPSSWVPLPFLLDASQLSEWVFEWEHGRDEELRRAVFDAGRRIREFTVPLYLLDTSDESWVKEVFYRVNQSGKRLEWEDIHDALFGHRGDPPSTLEGLREELAELGMGHLPKRRLMTSLIARHGGDVTQDLEEHLRRDPEFLRGAAAETLPILRRVWSFLRSDAGIPHLRLLPESWQIDTLTRFFSLHGAPKPRTRELLTRWIWRTFFDADRYSSQTMRRQGIAAIGEDEEQSAQSLLLLVQSKPGTRPDPEAQFSARTVASRLTMLMVAFEKPRHLETGSSLDLAELLDEQGADAFARWASSHDGNTSKWTRSIANRTLHPLEGEGSLSRLVVNRVRDRGVDDPVLRSHLVDATAAEFLLEGDVENFLRQRADTLRQKIEEIGKRMAGWEKNDRPSIEYLLQSEDVA